MWANAGDGWNLSYSSHIARRRKVGKRHLHGSGRACDEIKVPRWFATKKMSLRDSGTIHEDKV